jgi:hypothetical protein
VNLESARHPVRLYAHGNKIGQFEAVDTASARPVTAVGSTDRTQWGVVGPGRYRSTPGQHLGLVAVAHPRFGQQMAGPGRVVFQLLPQARHVKSQVVGALLESGTPH